ncbi:hypothetical protein ACU4GH_08140 [Bradyrhizobium betae]
MLLGIGLFISVAQFVTFYAAARSEGVLVIRGGVGFLNNLGLLATICANAVLPYLVRQLYENAVAFADSRAVKNRSIIDDGNANLRAIILHEGRYRFAGYGLVFVGFAFWTANTGIHLLGNAQEHWGHKVFDSIDHPIDFCLNRLNNVYAWMIVLPLCSYVAIFSAAQLVKSVDVATHQGALAYDLLNPDRCGGFASVERAHLITNVILAVLYVLIALHTETFARMNPEHALAYAAATLVLLFGNTIFIGSIGRHVRKLRTAALNEQKDRVYKNDALSLEILKFYYDHSRTRFQFGSILTKAVAIGIPAILKAAPALLETSRPFILL